MKKVVSLIAIIGILLIALTGCVNVNYEVKVNKDGTADVSYIYGFDKETLKQLETTSENMTADMKGNAETEGYTIEAYSDDEIEGFKASKHIENPSELSFEEVFGSEYVKDNEGNGIKIEKEGKGTVYSQDAKLDLSSMDETTASLVSMKYTVKLPVASKDNNADEVSKDGKTLTWKLKAGELNEIKFEAKGSTSSLIIKIVLIAFAVIVIICLIYVAVKFSKKSKNTTEAETKKEENE